MKPVDSTYRYGSYAVGMDTLFAPLKYLVAQEDGVAFLITMGGVIYFFGAVAWDQYKKRADRT
ncbi:hypothetical protein HY970_02265 [Candidatus Kaiserbacteria bacterium]|nr:hypothetical protein [Candidatus Kaiserbacteria bacterium]